MEAIFNALGNTQMAGSTVTLGVMDEDLKLAMILQQQEQAYAQLSGPETGFEGQSLSEEATGYTADEAAEAEAGVSDEEFARRLQQEDDRSFYRQLAMLEGDAAAGQSNSEQSGVDPGQLDISEDDLDIDNLDYETLQALGDAIGTVGKGLGSVGIAALPTLSYASHKRSSQEGSVMDRCCICQESYTGEDDVTLLPCKHCYHPPCIQQWLALNKVCPVCNLELGSSEIKHRH